MLVWFLLFRFNDKVNNNIFLKFHFKDSSNFYVLAARKKGVTAYPWQLKRVRSSTGPHVSWTMASAISTSSVSITGQTEQLWTQPNPTNTGEHIVLYNKLI